MFLSLFFFLYYIDIYVISVTYRVLDKVIPLWQNDVRTTTMMEKKRFQYSDIIQNLKNDYNKFEKCNEYKKLGNYKKENEKRKTSCKTISQFILDIVRLV